MELELRLVSMGNIIVNAQTIQTRFALSSRGLKYFLIICVGLSAVLLFLLATASANTTLFSRHFSLLLYLNVGVVLCLSGIVVYQIWVLRYRLRARIFGAKLTLRLVLFFALMAVLPGALVYSVSVQFLARSIDSWFDVRVDKALEGSLRLGRATFDNMLKEITKKAEGMALLLSERPIEEHLSVLNKLREENGVQEASLFNQRGTLIAFSGNEKSGLFSETPDASILRRVRLQKPYSAIIDSPSGQAAYLRVVVPVNVLSINEDIRVLQIIQTIPPHLAQDADTVQLAYRDYQQLSLSRVGLKRLYGLTLTLTLLLGLLSAFGLAFVLSERLSAPLSILAEGTRAVAQGDFTPRQEVFVGRDELGILTQSFNQMTRQLADAQETAQRSRAELEAAKTYVESVLANLSSGVISFDSVFKLRAVNASATTILNIDFAPLYDIALDGWEERCPQLGTFTKEILQCFKDSQHKEWQKQLEYNGNASPQVLLVRGTRLPEEAEGGYVVVFDDISHLLQAQRHAAWAEVARRLAHEIKNPLTPIQLSAERLQLKLAEKLDQNSAEILERSTQTIVNQVTALKGMVNAFSQYAKAPEPSLQQVDLNLLVREVMGLYESASGHIKLELARALPQVVGDPAQLRQVIHNLLQNAQDATNEVAQPEIIVRTEMQSTAVSLSILDNGSGFPEQLKKRLFEPYVTTKVKGTGLGLAIVKKIIDEHSALIEIDNRPEGGAKVSIHFIRVADGLSTIHQTSERV